MEAEISFEELCPACRVFKALSFNVEEECSSCERLTTARELARLRGAITLALTLLVDRETGEAGRHSAIRILTISKELSARAS